jgi:hypothetical protein
MSSLSLVQSCLWTVTRCVPLVQQKLDKIEQGWVNSWALIKVRSFCCTRGIHRVTVQSQDWTRLSELMCCYKGKNFLLHYLVQSCLWTVTRWVPLVQQKRLTFTTAHEFTQSCSILSLNSDTMGAPSAAENSYLYNSTWVHSAFTVQRQDWTRLSELMCCDKGKKFLLH